MRKKNVKKRMNMNKKLAGASGLKRVLGKPNNRRKWVTKMNLTPPDWSQVNLEVIKKNFYEEHPHVTARDEATTIKEYRDQNKITVKGRDCPKPGQAFDEFNFSECVMSAIKEQNFVTPTPIQSQAIPVALSGRDLVGIAETGSGKTLAYILPALTHIQGKQHPRNNGEPDVVVLAPTRELARQIHQVVESLGPGIKVTSECFYGGTKRMEQKLCAEKVFEICIATPGRMVDFLYEELIKLHRCTYFVLDEADRMLDMGFEPQIKMVIGQARPDRQMLMFSATWPPEIRNLAETYLKDYIMVNIGSLGISANHNITQKVVICEEEEKPIRIVKIMKDVMKQKENKTLIFVNSKVDVDLLTLKFRLNGWEAMGLHGNKKQAERDQVFGDFKTGKILILIATDLAARGLDVDDIKFIINYDFPNCSEDYVHRIGRTGRCNRTGTAITFFTKFDRNKAGDLISVLEEAEQQVDDNLQNLADLPALSAKGRRANPPGMKMRKKQLKKLMKRRSLINNVPLGTTTNTERLPDLDDIDHIISLSGQKASKFLKKKKPQDGNPQQVPESGESSKKKLKTSDNNDPTKSSVSGNGNSQNVKQDTSNRDLMFPENYQWQQEMGQNCGMPFGNAPVDVRNESWGFPLHNRNMADPGNPGNMGMPMNPGNMGMPTNPENVGMPMNSGNMGMPMNSGNMGMPMNPENLGMPVNRGNMGMPMNRGNMGMPMNRRNMGMPGNMGMSMNPTDMGMSMNSRNMDTGTDSRNEWMPMDHRGMETPANARGNNNTVSPLNRNDSSMGWPRDPRMGSSAYSSYMGHQNSNWGDYRSRYSLNRTDVNRYSAQSSWSGRYGYNPSSNKHGSGSQKMFIF